MLIGFIAVLIISGLNFMSLYSVTKGSRSYKGNKKHFKDLLIIRDVTDHMYQ